MGPGSRTLNKSYLDFRMGDYYECPAIIWGVKSSLFVDFIEFCFTETYFA